MKSGRKVARLRKKGLIDNDLLSLTTTRHNITYLTTNPDKQFEKEYSVGVNGTWPWVALFTSTVAVSSFDWLNSWTPLGSLTIRPPIVNVNYNDTVVVHAINGLGDGPTSIHHHVSSPFSSLSLFSRFASSSVCPFRTGIILQRYELLRWSSCCNSMRYSSWSNSRLHRSGRSSMGNLLVRSALPILHCLDLEARTDGKFAHRLGGTHTLELITKMDSEPLWSFMHRQNLTSTTRSTLSSYRIGTINVQRRRSRNSWVNTTLPEQVNLILPLSFLLSSTRAYAGDDRDNRTRTRLVVDLCCSRRYLPSFERECQIQRRSFDSFRSW